MPAAKPFWTFVHFGPSCWEWMGAKTDDGYGYRMVNNKKKLAHRLSWTMENGDIPSGLHVLHRCDNPPCVRPGHLFLGDQATNAKDMVAKGRHHCTVKTACPLGHAYTWQRNGRQRVCNKCKTAKQAGYRARKRLAVVKLLGRTIDSGSPVDGDKGADHV